MSQFSRHWNSVREVILVASRPYIIIHKKLSYMSVSFLQETEPVVLNWWKQNQYILKESNFKHLAYINMGMESPKSESLSHRLEFSSWN